MRIIASLLVYSNFFVALVLSALTASTYFMHDGLHFDWLIVGFIFLSSFLLYSFHRVYKLDSIPLNYGGDRHHWIKENYKATLIAMVVSIVGLIIILPNLSPEILIWLAPAGIISMGYTVPLIPHNSKWIRIRDIPLVKPFVIAFVVSYLTYSFPILDQKGAETILNSGHLAGLFDRFLFVLIVTIPFEVRDLESDRSAKLKTIATTLGVLKSKLLSIGLTLIWAIVATINIDFVPWRMIGVIILSAMLVFALLKLDRLRGELAYALVFEGLIIVYALIYSVLSVFGFS